jgi:oligopeptide transport system permease protein
MARYLAKRVFYLLLTLFLIASITFFLMKLMPGTPLTNQAKLTKAQIQIIYEQYGLNKPVWQQYLTYMINALHGNFGTSFQFSNQEVSYLIGSRIGPSATIGVQGMILGVFLGIITGSISAIRKNSWVDGTANVISILGLSVPSFVLAIVLQYYIGLKLQWLPVAGWGGFASTVLPSFALAANPFATTSRFVRTEMVDILGSDYIELARAKGMSKMGIVFHHALRNSLIPLVTVVGPLAVAIMTGSMVVENIFSIPGIGEQFVKSILTNDYPTIMGVTMLYSGLLCLVLLLTDIIYGIIDPRIRISGKGA